MSPFQKKKPSKPGVTVAIGGGKPKGDDLGAPDDPFGKKPDAHEAAETPEYEEQEETGADLLSAMTKPMIDAGLSDDDARTLLADVLDAACDSLRGGKESAEPPMEEAAEPEMGSSPYGR